MIATSHRQYGRMAFNLAMTLKAAEPDMPIILLHDAEGVGDLSTEQRGIFDTMTAIDGGKDLIGINSLRMRLPALTPYTETLALDVDMLWLSRKPSELFALLDGRDFTAVNEGYYDTATGTYHTSGIYTHWADPAEIAKAYNLTGKLYQLRGEVILFRKSAELKKMYSQAKKIQAAPALDVQQLGGSVTDEFALNIAASAAGIEPHESNWQPAYWANRHGGIVPEIHELHASYYALSLGGNSSNYRLQRAHDFIVMAAARKIGQRHVFPLKPKQAYLTYRKKA